MEKFTLEHLKNAIALLIGISIGIIFGFWVSELNHNTELNKLKKEKLILEIEILKK